MAGDQERKNRAEREYLKMKERARKTRERIFEQSKNKNIYLDFYYMSAMNHADNIFDED